MAFNYSKLLGRIVEICGTQANFAEAMNLSERTISLKLNNKINWKQSEIEQACSVLQIHYCDIPAYFFATKSQY